MDILGKLLLILDTDMEVPKMYGWFHLSFFALSVIIGIALCKLRKRADYKFVRKLLFSVSVIVLLLEIYKQINYSFTYDGQKINFDYQWYIFPFQFCSTPMYAALLASIVKKGKLHYSLCAYLATFSMFAGLCVMLYPQQVFIGTIGINVQSMVCHGSMLTVGIYLLYTGYVKAEHKTIFNAVFVFAVFLLLAMIMNETAYRSGILERETFNMFFISPYCEPSLPVYSSVQAVVPYPWCLFIYIVAFSLAAYVILLVPILVKYIKNKKIAKLQEESQREEIFS